MELEKINKHLNWNAGIYNSKNEQTLCKCINILFDQIDVLVDANNDLEERLKALEK